MRTRIVPTRNASQMVMFIRWPIPLMGQVQRRIQAFPYPTDWSAAAISPPHASAQMPSYSCYLLDSKDRIKSRTSFIADDDAAAFAKAAEDIRT
jgi:hypothetical protein